jgi:hypothetical protein
MANAGVDERGAVFTRPEVVDFILDLVGYTPDRALHQKRLLEPSCGHGDFLLRAIDRLLAAWSSAGRPEPYKALARAITAVELHSASVDTARLTVADKLVTAGIEASTAEALAAAWIVQGDFLLLPLDGDFDTIVGNPPYIRQEMIPDVLMAEYRARYRTIYDRADIYVPFIERSLLALSDGGQLGFICSDRWMKNKYGGPLRELVADRFHLKTYVDMVDTPAFHADVIAYPAITVIGREKRGPTRIVSRPNVEANALSALAKTVISTSPPEPSSGVREICDVTAGASPWILDSSDQLDLVRRLERDFPTIEDAGCKVGIGVATGADNAFCGPFDDLDVEPDRKLPMVTTRDIATGSVVWRGQGVINPFGEDGKLVELARYPRLKAYLEARRHLIDKRHVAQKTPANWYRTIDRIYPKIAAMPKLLIPDIKGAANIVYEKGHLYPHHNLYFIVSQAWDIKALQAVLMSGIARLFVATYSTKMRGGYLRFQAQYLRRIRLPRWEDVSSELKARLVEAAGAGDIAKCNQAAFELYGLSQREREALGDSGDNGT